VPSHARSRFRADPRRVGCGGGLGRTNGAARVAAALAPAEALPRGRIEEFGILQLPKKVAECAEGVVRDRPVHRWARGARARRPCAASITPSASSTPAEGLGGARLPALQHPACPLDACARRNRQVRTSTRTLRPATREVAQRAQRHARVLRSGRRYSLAGGARSAESCRGDLAILRALLSGRGLGAVVVACAR
jgi:hypothetical protein